ncbi:MAG: hypothetical protein H7Y13_11835 [Sphingobacteriaceae bacterium]|nr:hypothetical protein [Sphingobacteriaceae bacterium]
MSKLIITIDEVQNYVAVNATSSIDTLLPYMRLAERNYLEPVLGFAFLASLEETYTNAEKDVEAIVDDKTKTVVKYCQEIISNLSILHALPILSVQIGVNGIQVVKNDNMAPASQWRTNQVFDSLGDIGHKTIDSLLAYLELEKGHFAAWAADPVYQSYQKYFIRSAVDFSDHYNINGSRFLFHLIQYCMSRVETFEIKKAVGSALFDKLKLDDKAGTINGKLKTLLNDYLKPAIALFTIAKALQERLIDISSGTLKIKFSGTTENMDETRAPQLAELNQVMDSLTKDARNWIADGQEFIKDNPADFEAFAPTGDNRKRMNFDNGSEKRIFIW